MSIIQVLKVPIELGRPSTADPFRNALRWADIYAKADQFDGVLSTVVEK